MPRDATLILVTMALMLGMPVQARTLEGRAVTIDAPAGKLEGRVADGVAAFVGIPYVQAPVGPLRWRAPQPMPRWQGVRPAASFGNDCPQVAIPGDATPSDQPKSEDCLFLNVWRPEHGAKLPVMVWIHGGGWIAGSSATPVTDGANLARRDVVVVSFNYRLGRFGFFAHPALEKDQPADYAFLDMIAALKWVQANIAAFGGDPGRVTVFGESAGGAAVNFLLASPLAKGLFAQAIVESGANRDSFSMLDRDRPNHISAFKAGENFAKAAGLSAGADAAALRALPAATVQGGISFADTQTDRFSGPVVGGGIVPADPIERFKAGEAPALPYLIGSNGHELSEESFAPIILDAILKYTPPDALAVLRKAYGDPLDPAVIDDTLFGEATRGYARIMARRGTPTWLYRFDYVAEVNRAKRKAANHASEIQYVFGNLPAIASDADKRIAQQMGDYWTNCAKTGNPNGEGLAAWPAAGSAGDPMLLITDTGAKAALDDDPRLDAVERAASLWPR